MSTNPTNLASAVDAQSYGALLHAIGETAEAAGIEIQMGLTQGGTDGTRFTYYGAPNQGLSWPGRYSHSPGEVLDLRDLASLAELIQEGAMAGEG